MLYANLWKAMNARDYLSHNYLDTVKDDSLLGTGTLTLGTFNS